MIYDNFFYRPVLYFYKIIHHIKTNTMKPIKNYSFSIGCILSFKLRAS